MQKVYSWFNFGWRDKLGSHYGKLKKKIMEKTFVRHYDIFEKVWFEDIPICKVQICKVCKVKKKIFLLTVYFWKKNSPQQNKKT